MLRSLAICTRCGEEKAAALMPCTRCGRRPLSADEVARSLWLSERYHDLDHLLAYSQQLKNDQPIEFDPIVVGELTTELDSQPQVLRELSDPYCKRIPWSERLMWRSLAVGSLLAVLWLAVEGAVRLIAR